MLRSGMFAAVAMAAVFVSGSAAAGVVLDQQSVPETGVVASQGWQGSGLSQFAVGQNFTVDVTGTLSHLDVGLFHAPFVTAGNVQFQLLDGSGATLFSEDIAAAQIPELDIGSTLWTQIPTIDLSAAHLHVDVGDHLAFTLRADSADDSADFLLSFVNGQPITYGGGTSFLVVGGQHLPTQARYAFRSYVAIPEPAEWAILVLGFGGAGVVLRRRQVAA
jgi:hypothetical protein